MNNDEEIELRGRLQDQIYEDINNRFYINHVRFKNCIFKNVVFSNSPSTLCRSFFDGSYFENCKFINCEFVGTHIRSCGFDGTEFINCKGIIDYGRTINFKKTNTVTNTSLLIKQIDELITINGKKMHNSKYNGYDVRNLIIDDNWKNTYQVRRQAV